jgi:NOL1/NOP2/fmu family ribosome biogenesis protein
VTYLEATLNVLQVGITVGEIKGDQVLPHPALALSTRLNRAAFPVSELSLKQAVDYLRREALVLPEACPRGWVLLAYQDQTLGWAKNLGTRANNGWPAEWRIRSANPFA